MRRKAFIPLARFDIFTVNVLVVGPLQELDALAFSVLQYKHFINPLEVSAAVFQQHWYDIWSY